MSFLMPTAVRPAVGLCGTYVAVGSSNGEKALSGITQVITLLERLMNFLSLILHIDFHLTHLYLNLFNDLSQVLMNVLSSRKNMSDSLAYGRLHPHLQPNTLLVDCELILLIHLYDANITESLQTL